MFLSLCMPSYSSDDRTSYLYRCHWEEVKENLPSGVSNRHKKSKYPGNYLGLGFTYYPVKKHCHLDFLEYNGLRSSLSSVFVDLHRTPYKPAFMPTKKIF